MPARFYFAAFVACRKFTRRRQSLRFKCLRARLRAQRECCAARPRELRTFGLDTAKSRALYRPPHASFVALTDSMPGNG